MVCLVLGSYIMCHVKFSVVDHAIRRRSREKHSGVRATNIFRLLCPVSLLCICIFVLN